MLLLGLLDYIYLSYLPQSPTWAPPSPPVFQIPKCWVGLLTNKEVGVGLLQFKLRLQILMWTDGQVSGLMVAGSASENSYLSRLWRLSSRSLPGYEKCFCGCILDTWQLWFLSLFHPCLGHFHGLHLEVRRRGYGATVPARPDLPCFVRGQRSLALHCLVHLVQRQFNDDGDDDYDMIIT